MATALLVAAGSGERLGVGSPKALVELAGEPMIAWSMRSLAASEAVIAVVVAAPARHEARIDAVAREAAPTLPLQVVTGGSSRSESVRSALSAAGSAEVVLVHDAARPLARPDLFDLCVNELERFDCDGVVAAVPVTDTIKTVDADRRVTDTLDRSTLWAVQTPQAFRATVLGEALAGANDLGAVTDDAQLVERIGGDVRIAPARPDNIKVTVPADLKLAELLVADGDAD
ncbi:MAG: 2-C-methyl-D-erythritol 4-phosphate cytidylyltransferase [Solirubrobacterales bacterium]